MSYAVGGKSSSTRHIGNYFGDDFVMAHSGCVVDSVCLVKCCSCLSVFKNFVVYS